MNIIELLNNKSLEIINNAIKNKGYDNIECKYILPHSDNTIKVVLYKTVKRISDECMTLTYTDINDEITNPIVNVKGDYFVKGMRLNDINTIAEIIATQLNTIPKEELTNAISMLNEIINNDKLVIDHPIREFEYRIDELVQTSKNTLAVKLTEILANGNEGNTGMITCDTLYDYYVKNKLKFLKEENNNNNKITCSNVD